MNKILQIFKGGIGFDNEERLVVNQRPADGHIKSAIWESYQRLSKYTLKCDRPSLETGDVIQMHTGLTFGILHAWGIAVTRPEKGLKFKLVLSEPMEDERTDGFPISLDSFEFIKFVYKKNEENENDPGKYVAESSGTASDLEFGDEMAYYLIRPTDPSLPYLVNPIAFGFEVSELPSAGVMWDFDIESRLHNSQPVRPAANLGCC